MTVTDDKTDATNPCKSDSCCANVTLKIMQVRYRVIKVIAL